jgi:hypothetical protein
MWFNLEGMIEDAMFPRENVHFGYTPVDNNHSRNRHFGGLNERTRRLPNQMWYGRRHR